MNSKWLWSSHQRHKLLTAEASRDILEFRVLKTPFLGVFKRYFYTADAMLLCQNTRKTVNFATEMSQLSGVSQHGTVRTFHRSKPLYICVECHSSSLFDDTYFLLAVTVDGDESSGLRMANYLAVFAGYRPLLTALMGPCM